MSQDQPNSDGFRPAQGLGSTELNVDATNRSSIVRAIIGIGVLLVAGAVGVHFWLGSQKVMEEHKNVRAAFDDIHKRAYTGFWKAMAFKAGGLEDKAALEREMLNSIRKDPRGFSKRLKSQGAPVVDAALVDFMAIRPPQAYADKLEGVVKAQKAIRDNITNLADELFMIDSFLQDEAKLSKMDDAWFNAQTWQDAQYYTEAFKYYKFLRCAIGGKSLINVPPLDIGPAISKRCEEDDKTALFKKIGFDCYPMLSGKDTQPDEEFKVVIATWGKSFKGKPEGKVDSTSGQNITACMKAGRNKLESDLVQEFEKVFVGYLDARKAFLDANNAAMGQQR